MSASHSTVDEDARVIERHDQEGEADDERLQQFASRRDQVNDRFHGQGSLSLSNTTDAASSELPYKILIGRERGLASGRTAEWWRCWHVQATLESLVQGSNKT